MSGGQVFVDTNILVYAHDNRAGARHSRARTRLRELLTHPRLPIISAQVLHELYVNLVRLGVGTRPARELVSTYLGWQVISNDSTLATEAMAAAERWQISMWDALIISAARRGGAEHLWSEDLNAGQDYGGVKVVNPLA